MPNVHRLTLACAGLALLLVGSMAAEAPAKEEREVKIEIRKVHVDCDDNDADCGEHVFVGHGRGRHGASFVFHGPQGRAFAFAGAHLGKGGHLGVALSELTPELRTHFGVPDDLGVMISQVLEDSPALVAGIEVGDIITAVDGEDISSPDELAREIRSREGGDTVVLNAWRDGQLLKINATLEETEGHMQMAHRGIILCSEGEDCEIDVDIDHDFNFNFDHSFDFGCEDGEDCRVRIECENSECTCTVNGENTDCPAALSELHSLHHER